MFWLLLIEEVGVEDKEKRAARSARYDAIRTRRKFSLKKLYSVEDEGEAEVKRSVCEVTQFRLLGTVGEASRRDCPSSSTLYLPTSTA